METRLIFTDFIVWWPWKLGSRNVQTSFLGQNLTFKVQVWPGKWGQSHQNLIISFYYLSGVSVQVWSKSTNSFRGVETRLIFTVFIVWWPWKLGHGHQIPLIIPIIQYIKFGPNPLFVSRDRVQTLFGQNLIFKVLVWPWKWGHGHQNPIISSPCLSGVSVQVWSKSTNSFRRKSANNAHFYNL